MKRILARDLLDIPADELWDYLTGEFILVMDDGHEFKTNFAETCYSSYAWNYHRQYRLTPLLKEHHVRGVSGSRRFSISIDLTLLGNALLSTYDAYSVLPPEQRVPMDPDLWKLAYEVVDGQYNAGLMRAGAHANTIDILHFHELYDQPEIYEANRAVQMGEIHVNDVYKVIDNVLVDKKRLNDNPVALEYRSKLLKQTQVHQNIGPRGNTTDMNSRIFNVAILRSYVEGLRKIYEGAAESRPAARAAYYQEESLRRSEYFSRKLQFVAQNVKNLHQDCDCGSTQYLEWKIRDRKIDERGEMARDSDLVLFEGKHFLNEETGKLETIRPDRVDLLDKTLKIRNVFDCMHPDPVGVCSTCFGEMALSVPNDSNLGQWCATEMAAQATQVLLSAKHLERTMALDKIELSEEDQKILWGGKDNSSYVMSPALAGKEVYVIFAKKNVESLNDIYSVEDVREQDIDHYSEMTSVTVRVVTYLDDIAAERDYTVSVGVEGTREASISHELLEYIKEQGRQHKTVLPNGSYCINLADWEWDDPILRMPAKHYNNSDHVDRVAKMLESRVTEMRKRATLIEPKKMLKDLFDFVNWKLNVNMSCMEVILYATTIVSMENNDYSLPKPWTDSQLSVLSLTMRNRSLSVMMAFERQYDALMDVTSFMYNNRFDHLFDVLFNPNEVLGLSVK